MDPVTRAMGNLASKLLQLLQAEYRLHKGLRKKIQFLSEELDSIHAALEKVAAVPLDQLDEKVKIWAHQVREASYDMEDILDTFLVRVEGCPKEGRTGHGRLKRALKRMSKLFTRAKDSHNIAIAIEDIKEQLEEVAKRRASYRVDEIIVPKTAASYSSAIHPRLQAMHDHEEVTSQLVGIEGAMGELMSMLSIQRGQVTSGELKIVSVFGVGGLGKTTLAKGVYDELKSQFDCGAFVMVGRNPYPVEIFRDILIELDENRASTLIWDQRELIYQLRYFLRRKRYFIVIDDIWEKQIWETLRLVFKDENTGSRIVLTTRTLEDKVGEVYKPKALSDDNSKRLFYTRLFGKGKYPDDQVDEVSDKILRRCGGIPLAIITMAGLLAGKSKAGWLEVCDSTSFRDKDTMSILYLSYYDLPLHLRTCLLYLCAFPEDHTIDKNSLIWRWIAEGFVQKKQQGIGLFEVGEGYFNDLVNRSLIQAVESKHDDIIVGCRVHDMVLDLLRFLSSEENFITILDNNEGTSSISSARRLAHKKSTRDARLEITRGIGKLRSLIAHSYFDELPFWRFGLLRVLHLEDVYMTSWHNAKNLQNLLHLRYLSFKRTDMPELPKEIGAVKFLQTLHLVRNTYIQVLPSSVGQLTNLLCLHAWGWFCQGMGMPNGIIKKLTSLEELVVQCGQDRYKGQFKELRYLSELRVLTIKVTGMDQSMLSDLLQSVGDLHKIESIKLEDCSCFPNIHGAIFDTVMLPQRLRHLVVGVHNFSRFPSCIDPLSLFNLNHLELKVIDMDEQSMKTLGGLPELRHLVLGTMSTVTVTNIAVAGCFQKLRSCEFSSSVVLFWLNEDESTVSFTLWNGYNEIAFGSRKEGECTTSRPPIVMPSLQELAFTVTKYKFVRKYKGIFGNCGLDFLTSLRKLTVTLDYDQCFFERDMREVEAGLRHAIDVHPTHPRLIFKRINDEDAQETWSSMLFWDDDRSEENKVSGRSDEDVSSSVVEQQEDHE